MKTKPTSRALRNTLAAALGLAPWSVFYASRVVNRLNVIDDDTPTARVLSLVTLAILATSPHKFGRSAERTTHDARTMTRMALLSALKPQRLSKTPARPLPYAWRIFDQRDLTFAAALELLIEQASDPNVAVFLKRSQDDANKISADAIELSLHAPAEHPRVALTVRLNDGQTFECTFAQADDVLAPAAASLTLRVGLDARGILALSRLARGDASGEAMLTDGHPREAVPLPVDDPIQPEPAMTVPPLTQMTGFTSDGRQWWRDPRNPRRRQFRPPTGQ